MGTARDVERDIWFEYEPRHGVAEEFAFRFCPCAISPISLFGSVFCPPLCHRIFFRVYVEGTAFRRPRR